MPRQGSGPTSWRGKPAVDYKVRTLMEDLCMCMYVYGGKYVHMVVTQHVLMSSGHIHAATLGSNFACTPRVLFQMVGASCVPSSKQPEGIALKHG